MDWCFRRKVDAFNPSVNIFCEVLIFIHDKKPCPATVKGYRSAISTTLKPFSKVDFFQMNPLYSFVLERPRARPQTPKWDVALILLSLCSVLYVSSEYCGQRELILKKCILVALAAGRRRSETHAFSCSEA